MVVLLPAQMVSAAAETVTVGEALTVIVFVAVAVQPDVVPVTVYVVVVAGEMEMEVPARLPGAQVYVAAPPAVSVVLLPEQIVDAVAETVTVGVAFTVISKVAVPEQPAVVPVTVYVVVDAGVTVHVEPVWLPGFHV